MNLHLANTGLEYVLEQIFCMPRNIQYRPSVIVLGGGCGVIVLGGGCGVIVLGGGCGVTVLGGGCGVIVLGGGCGVIVLGGGCGGWCEAYLCSRDLIMASFLPSSSLAVLKRHEMFFFRAAFCALSWEFCRREQHLGSSVVQARDFLPLPSNFPAPAAPLKIP